MTADLKSQFSNLECEDRSLHDPSTFEGRDGGDDTSPNANDVSMPQSESIDEDDPTPAIENPTANQAELPNGENVIPLTELQRELVAGNIGLVGVHLRHHTGFLTPAQRRNQWSDLFQEGCLGLIRAAATYGENNPIPFAAWALKRIHMYVSRAMQRERDAAHTSDNLAFLADGTAHPRAGYGYVAKIDAAHGIETLDADNRELTPEPPTTIGERLREKYERAAQLAARTIHRRASERGDREALIRILIDERFLVPDEHSRRGLRQIARYTDSSITRVLHCERQIAAAMCAILRADPEFVELERRARESQFGVATPINARLEASLATTCTREFARRMRSLPHIRAALIERLWTKSADELSNAASRIFVKLSWQDREEVLQTDTA